jgi:hypothetical protein
VETCGTDPVAGFGCAEGRVGVEVDCGGASIFMAFDSCGCVALGCVSV